MDHVVQFIRCFGTSWITHSPNFTLRIQRASQCYLCIKVQLSLVHNRAHFETDTTCTLTWSTPAPIKVVHWQWPPISPRSKQFTRQQVNIIWKHSQGIVKTCVIAYGWITLAFCVLLLFWLVQAILTVKAMDHTAHASCTATGQLLTGLWQKDIGACCFINQIVFVLFSCLPPHSTFAQLSQPVDIPFVFPVMLVGKALIPFQSFSFYINEQGSYATLYPWSLKNRHWAIEFTPLQARQSSRIM